MISKLTPSLLSSIFMISLGSSNAHAQSAFAGFYGQISTGYEGNQLGSISGGATEIPNVNTDTNITAPSQTFGGTPLILGAGTIGKPVIIG